MVNARIIEERTTAMVTYSGVSLFVRSRVSETTQDMPERKQFLSANILISLTAERVPSEDVVSSKIIINRVAPSLLNFLYSLSGKSLIGIAVSAKELYHTADLT